MTESLPKRKPRTPWLAALLACLAPALVTGCHKTQVVYNPAASAPALGPQPAPSTTARRPPAPATGTKAPDTGQSAQELARDYGPPVSTEIGLASWYGPPYHNHQAADGSIFDQNALTVAHRTLPMGTVVRVTNLATDESVIARITDRGPFIPGRTLDLSLAAAKAIGVYRVGVARVKVEAFANPTADPAGRWCVQIGVFIDPADAVQLKNDLSRRYTTAKVIEFTGPTGHWVRINPAQPDQRTAARIADTIHLPDAEPYLVRLN